MIPPVRSLLPLRDCYLPLLERLADLFDRMDQAYASVAGRYGFVCRGCADNCCLTRFYHHTLLEYLYLREGLDTLDPATRSAVHRRAGSVNAELAEADQRGEARRRMCPLNQDGWCRVYAFRPMICRLHGIPHELHPPGGRIIRHPGCDDFFSQCRTNGREAYIPFDRTPHYQQMATLEKALRQATGYPHKIKLTIAQMLVSIIDEAHEND